MTAFLKWFSVSLIVFLGMTQNQVFASRSPADIQTTPLPQPVRPVNSLDPDSAAAPRAVTSSVNIIPDSALSEPQAAEASSAVGPATTQPVEDFKIVKTSVRTSGGKRYTDLTIAYDNSKPWLVESLQIWSATSVTGPWKFESQVDPASSVKDNQTGIFYLHFSKEIKTSESFKFFKVVSTLKYKSDGPRDLTFTVMEKKVGYYEFTMKWKLELYGPVDAVGIYRRQSSKDPWYLEEVIAHPDPISYITRTLNVAYSNNEFKVEPMPQISQNYPVARASRSYVKSGDLRLYAQNRLPDGTLSAETAHTIKSAVFDPTYTDADFKTIEALARTGLNTVRLNYPLRLDSSAVKILDAFYQYGIRVIMKVDAYYPSNDLSWYAVNQLKNHPAILMWETSSVSLIDRIKREDPNHAVAIVVSSSDVTGNHASIANPLHPIPANADVISINLLDNNSLMEAVSMWSKAASKPLYVSNFQHATDWDDLFFDLSASRADGRVIGGSCDDHFLTNSNYEQDYLALQVRYSNQDYSPKLQNQATLSLTLSSSFLGLQVNQAFENIHYEKFGEARGIQVSVLDEKTGTRMRDIIYFDTGAFDLTKSIIDFYNSQPNESIITFVTGAGGGFFDPTTNKRFRPALDEFFKEIGSKEVENLKDDSIWAFVIKKGSSVLAEQVSSKWASLRLTLTIPLMPSKPVVPSVEVSFKSGLTARDVNALSGLPFSHIMDGSNVSTTTDYLNGRLRLNYNVGSPTPVSGLAVDFDNYTTPYRETGNLSSMSKLILGLSGSAQSIYVRFQDADGHTGDFKLNQISTSERYWSLDLSLLPSNVDRSQIRAVYFFVAPESLAKTQTAGSFSLLLNGVNTSKPLAPQWDPTTPTLSTMDRLTIHGSKPAYSAVYIQGALVAPADSSTRWSTELSLDTEGLNSFLLTSKNQQGVASDSQTLKIYRDAQGPVGTVALSNGKLNTETSDITLKLTASDPSGVDSMSFSVDGSERTPWESFATSKKLTLLNFGDNKIFYYVRDKLGHVSTYTLVVKTIGSSAASLLSQKLASLLTDASVPLPPGLGRSFVSRMDFLDRLLLLGATERAILYSYLSTREQTLLNMLVAATQSIPSFVTDAELTTMAQRPVFVQGFSSPDFVNNLTVLESMDPKSVMAFMGLLSTPTFDYSTNSSVSWASDSLAVVVMNARWNELARQTIIGKLLLLEGAMPIPLTARYYFTWSQAPNINITFAPITFTAADLPALKRLLSSPIEAYRTWAAEAIASIH